MTRNQGLLNLGCLHFLFVEVINLGHEYKCKQKIHEKKNKCVYS